MEIERKFLVTALPSGLSRRAKSKIRQGYFLLRDNNIEVRVRERDAKHCITIKAGRGVKRLEEEIPIPKERFHTIWPLVCAASLLKTRYRIPYEGMVIELDVYEGRHRGLRIAEVEFSSAARSRRFTAPAWFGREITDDARYANASLAKRRHL